MSNVIRFRGVTRLDLDPDMILEAAKGNVDRLVIIGYDKNKEFYFASTMGDGGDVLWLMEKLKAQLMGGE